MSEQMGEQAAQVLIRAGTEVTLDLIREIIEKLLADRANHVPHGQQSIKQLTQQHNQKLENIELTAADLKALKTELKRYGVDFAVMKDKETGNHSVFFKAKDEALIYKALSDVVKGVLKDDKSQDQDQEKQPMKETMHQAEQKAAAQNQNQQRQEQNKTAEADRGDR